MSNLHPQHNNNDYSILYILQCGKEAAAVLLICLLCWGVVRSIIFIDSAQLQVETLSIKTGHVFNTTNTVLRDIQTTTRLQRELFENEKNQEAIGLAIRSGKNILRMSQIGVDVLRHVKTQTLPLSDQVLLKVGDAVVHIDSSTTNALDKTADVAEQIHIILNKEELQQIPKLLLEVSQNTAETSKSINDVSQFTEEQIKQNLPLLLAELNSIANNTDSITYEISKFVEKINKPPSTKEKIFRALILALSVAAPVLVQTLRK